MQLVIIILLFIILFYISNLLRLYTKDQQDWLIYFNQVNSNEIDNVKIHDIILTAIRGLETKPNPCKTCKYFDKTSYDGMYVCDLSHLNVEPVSYCSKHELRTTQEDNNNG